MIVMGAATRAGTGPDDDAAGPASDRRIVLDGPVVAVVVYPKQARVTRRAQVRLPVPREPGVLSEVAFEGLPAELDADSVRVTGRGPARVLGVDVEDQPRSEPTEEALADLEARKRTLDRRIAELSDADETERARRAFLEVAARTGAAALARTWAGQPPTAAGATGDGAAAQLVSAADLLAAQLGTTQDRQRAIAEERRDAERRLAAVERAIAQRRKQRDPDRRRVVVDLEVVAAGPTAETEPTAAIADVELEVSYLVPSAGWTSVYDARLDGERVTLTWFGMVSQRTGEDWPAGELTLSTARPAVSTTLPELPPWYVDVRRTPYPSARTRGGAAGMDLPGVPPPAPASAVPLGYETAAFAAAPPISESVAAADTSGAAATYRPARPVPVPADGAPHRTTVAVVDLDAVLDYLTVPKVAAEAYLRATVTNGSRHTLLPGKVSVFHGQDFVGSSTLPAVPPGAEVELHLGVDDRLHVERELVRRSTGKKVVGNVRRTDVAYRITLANHTPRPAKVTVRDQLPVSRHESVAVRDVTATPSPDERTDLGVLTWTLELPPSARKEVTFSFRLEHPRGADLIGWSD
jgi:uncharacterized protein (TIGR02231 family)